MAEKETWRNPGVGRIYIQVDTPQGVQDRCISPGGSINIDTSDRQMNQRNMSMDPSRDFFTNGKLIPVKLIDSAEDYEEISSNPNLIGDAEIAELLNKPRGFKKAIGEIANPVVLNRLKALSQEHDSVTAAQVRDLDARIEEVSPSLAVPGKTIRGAEDADTDFTEVKL